MHRSGAARRSAVCAAIAFAIAFATTAAARAQVSTATVQGTVTDNTGVLPGATVIARETRSGSRGSASG